MIHLIFKQKITVGATQYLANNLEKYIPSVTQIIIILQLFCLLSSLLCVHAKNNNIARYFYFLVSTSIIYLYSYQFVCSHQYQGVFLPHFGHPF